MKWIDAKNKKPELEYEDISVCVLVSDGVSFGVGYYDYDLKVWEYTFSGCSPSSDNSITHFAYVELP